MSGEDPGNKYGEDAPAYTDSCLHLVGGGGGGGGNGTYGVNFDEPDMGKDTAGRNACPGSSVPLRGHPSK